MMKSELIPTDPTTAVAADSQLHYGASWYPEMWPASEWPGDVAKMKEVGFTLVRVFEFAWKRFQPSENEWSFDWAREVLDLLHAAGIQAMIGTPTAAPPAWLTTAYPEVLGTKADGKREIHGKRKHYNPHSVKYLEFSRRIVAKMVEELGDHPAVHSWQIDNEMSGFDYGEETQRLFREWLAQEYGDIETLNSTWGLDFWSQAYDSFDQVPMVTANVGSIEQPERHHPSLLQAIARFQNQGWTQFMAEQVAEIRKSSNCPVTTNLTGYIGQMDWWRHFRVMDRAGVSMYADLAYYYYNYMRFDRLRGEKDAPFWMLETAPNWSGGGPVWNIHHDERGIRAFTWLSMLMGGTMVLYWQWRSHWAGQEMQHGTCVSQTGAWMPGKSTWMQMAREFKELGDFLIAHPAQKGPVAIMASCENAWLFSIDPIHPSNRYSDRIRDAVQMPLVRRHIQRDLIHTEADFSAYKLLIVPQLAMMPEETKARLGEWVAAGGRLLLGPLSGNRTMEMTLWKESNYGGLEDLMGADQSQRFSPHWVEETIDVVFEGGGSCHPEIWCDAFTPREGTEVLARYRGGYGDGEAAVVSRRHGEGRVITLGCPLDETCYMALFDTLAAEAGVEPCATGGEGVVSCPRIDPATGELAALGLVNSRKEPATIHLPFSGEDLLNGGSCGGEITLEPLQVRLIKRT
jgi:beta-galactosidase GanA